MQKSYWEEHSRGLTVESMMLDSRAADLDKEERPEVLCHITSACITNSPSSLSLPLILRFRCCWCLVLGDYFIYRAFLMILESGRILDTEK